MTYPFLKWAGGKRQLLPAILNRLPSEMGTFYEPFLGGGAVLFALAREGCFRKAVVNDVNQELVHTYETLRSSEGVNGVIALLKTYPYERTFYDEMRARIPANLTPVEAAARFIYLNRTGFNGLYRVNKDGRFNVPFGAYTNPTICDDSNLLAVRDCLKDVTFESRDFEESVAPATAGDVVYFDPPYLPKSATSNFTSYTEKGFSLAEHRRLAALFRRLADRGVRCLLSNSDVPLTRELYEGLKVETVDARRNINSDGDGRGAVTEILVSANLTWEVETPTREPAWG